MPRVFVRVFSQVACRLLLLAVALTAAAAARAETSLRAEGTAFVLDLGAGRQLRSPELVGAIFDAATPGGAPVRLRIDAVAPDTGRPEILLHDLRFEAAPGDWRPLCGADGQGRRLAFPLAGAWDGAGRFIADPERFFVTCTGGARGRCVLMGYDPWAMGPDGRALPALYEACQQMVRGAYCDGLGAAADDRAEIDAYDDHGIQRAETLDDPGFAFEAGWTPEGAVCLSHPRRPERIGRAALGAACPQLARAAPCDETQARAEGAALFNRSRSGPRP